MRVLQDECRPHPPRWRSWRNHSSSPLYAGEARLLAISTRRTGPAKYTIFPGAGDAKDTNSAIQTIDTWPRYVGDHQHTHGERSRALRIALFGDAQQSAAGWAREAGEANRRYSHRSISKRPSGLRGGGASSARRRREGRSWLAGRVKAVAWGFVAIFNNRGSVLHLSACWLPSAAATRWILWSWHFTAAVPADAKRGRRGHRWIKSTCCSNDPLRRGLYHFHRGEFGSAEPHFRAVVERSPDNVTAWIGTIG